MTTGFTFPTVPTTGKFTSTLLKQIINFRRANAANGSVRSVSQDDLDDADFGTINEAVTDLNGKGGTIVIKNSTSNYVVPATGFDLTTDPDWLIVGQTDNLITLDCTGVTGQIFKVNTTNTKIDIEKINFINVASGVPIVNATTSTTCIVKFVDCDITAVSGGVFLSETFDMSVELTRVNLINFTTTVNLVPATAAVGTVQFRNVTTNGLITLKSTAITLVRLTGSSAITLSGTGKKDLSIIDCSTLTLTGGSNTLQSIVASGAVSISDSVNCTDLTCTTLTCTSNVVSVLNTVTCTTLAVSGSADLSITGLNHSGAFSSSHTGTVLLQNVTATSNPNYTFSVATTFVLKQATGVSTIIYNQSGDLHLEDVSCTTLTTASSSGKVVLTGVTSSGNMTLTGSGKMTVTELTSAGLTLGNSNATLLNVDCSTLAISGIKNISITNLNHSGAFSSSHTGTVVIGNVTASADSYTFSGATNFTLKNASGINAITFNQSSDLRLEDVLCTTLTTASSSGKVVITNVTSSGNMTLTGSGELTGSAVTCSGATLLITTSTPSTINNLTAVAVAFAGTQDLTVNGFVHTGAVTNTRTAGDLLFVNVDSGSQNFDSGTDGSLTLSHVKTTGAITYSGGGILKLDHVTCSVLTTSSSTGVVDLNVVTTSGTCTLTGTGKMTVKELTSAGLTLGDSNATLLNVDCSTLSISGSKDISITTLNHSGAFSSSHTGTVVIDNVTASSDSYTFSGATDLTLKNVSGINAITYNQAGDLSLENVSCTTLSTASSSGSVNLNNVTTSGTCTLTGTGKLTGSAIVSGGSFVCDPSVESTISNLETVACTIGGTKSLTINGLKHTGAFVNTNSSVVTINNCESTSTISITAGDITINDVNSSSTITLATTGNVNLNTGTVNILTINTGGSYFIDNLLIVNRITDGGSITDLDTLSLSNSKITGIGSGSEVEMSSTNTINNIIFKNVEIIESSSAPSVFITSKITEPIFGSIILDNVTIGKKNISSTANGIVNITYSDNITITNSHFYNCYQVEITEFNTSQDNGLLQIQNSEFLTYGTVNIIGEMLRCVPHFGVVDITTNTFTNIPTTDINPIVQQDGIVTGNTSNNIYIQDNTFINVHQVILVQGGKQTVTIDNNKITNSLEYIDYNSSSYYIRVVAASGSNAIIECSNNKIITGHVDDVGIRTILDVRDNFVQGNISNNTFDNKHNLVTGTLTGIECDSDLVTITNNNIILATTATGTLTLTANVSNTETITIGSKVYTFQTTLTDVDGNILIGASASDSIDNLISGILRLAAGSGTLYAASMTANSNKIAGVQGIGDTMELRTDGSITTTETSSTASWTNTTSQVPVTVTAYGINLTSTSNNCRITNNSTKKNTSTIANVYIDTGTGNLTTFDTTWTTAGNGNTTI